jgi:hypothetical protein
MKAYKGFDKDLKCRGFQFEIGKEYKEKNAEICECGFHACESPLDVFRYYAPAESRFCEVDIVDNGQRQAEDSKVCGKKIKIGAEIGIPGLVKAHVEYVNSKIESTETNTGNYSASTNTGNYSASTNTGNYSASTNTGDYSASTNTGYQSASEVSGIGSVALVTGRDSKAKASIGSAIVIVEHGEWDGKTYPMLGIKAAIVDGEKIKADTWYKLINGEFVEVEE